MEYSVYLSYKLFTPTNVVRICIFFMLSGHLGFMSIDVLGQRPTYGSGGLTTPTTTAADDKVFLLGANNMIVNKFPDGSEVRRVEGNVSFMHKGSLMYCNLAIHNVASNAIEAYGNVRIVQGDSVTITGDTLFYFGNTRLAKMSGKVATFKDRKSTLTSTRLEYDMANGIAYYPNKGKTIDAENTLTSKEGYYNTRTKIFTYYKDVKLVNKKYTLTTDTLIYNSYTRIADFRSLTKVESKDGIVVARNGSYNTETGESVFRTRTTIDNPDYTLTGDSIAFDNSSKRGFAKGKVELVSKSDETVLNGDFGQYDGKGGKSKVWGHALTRTVISKDTLFMAADTLYSVDIKIDSTAKTTPSKVTTPKIDILNDTTSEKSKPRLLIARKNVWLYKSDLQSKCDSLIYNSLDSTITFLKKPILWAAKYQMEADTIIVQLVNQKLRTMYLRVKSFVIAQDTLFNFNQVKGRQITTYFDDSTRLQRVFVEGNGESIYFVADDSLKPMGMNRVECAKMTLNFKKNQVKKIQFVGQPEGKFIPPQQVKNLDKQLEGFSWRIKEKPTQKDILVRANFKPMPSLNVKLKDSPEETINKTSVKEVSKSKSKPQKKIQPKKI